MSNHPVIILAGNVEEANRYWRTIGMPGKPTYVHSPEQVYGLDFPIAIRLSGAHLNPSYFDLRRVLGERRAVFVYPAFEHERR